MYRRKILLAAAFLSLSGTAQATDYVQLYNGLGGGMFSSAMFQIAEAIETRCGNRVNVRVSSHATLAAVPKVSGRVFIAGASAGGPTAIETARAYKGTVFALYTLDPVATGPIPPNVRIHINWRTTQPGLGGGRPEGTKIDIPSPMGHLELIGSPKIRQTIVNHVCG